MDFGQKRCILAVEIVLKHLPNFDQTGAICCTKKKLMAQIDLGRDRIVARLSLLVSVIHLEEKDGK